MVKRITAWLAAAAAALSLVSCGDGAESSVRPIKIEESATAAIQTTTEPPSQPTTERPTYHERHDYEDGVLVGRWEGDEADIVLQENGKVTAEFDISEIMMIKDGVFMLSGEKEPPLEYDGTTLKIYANGEEEGSEPVEFLTLTRIDEPAPDSFDGLYSIDTEDFKQRLAGLFIDEETADIDVQMRIRRGHFIVCLPEFCDYSQNGDEFSLSLSYATDGSLADELTDSTFVLDGDSVTFYNSDGIPEQFERKE
ncbi:MAG: hypothetical protein Q4A05_04640 [Ruminococcus sp.]|nr:hypothetical protein [Ruminococcus sp.]